MTEDAPFDAPFDAPERPKGRPTAARPAQKPYEEAVEPAPADTAPKSEVQQLLEHKPSEVLVSAEHRAALLAEIRKEMAERKLDLATDKGRKAVASFAFKITKTKTALDDAGKKLNSSLREQINKVDLIRRTAWDELEALAIEARLPLTQWEAAETMRENKKRSVLDLIGESLKGFPSDTAQAIEQRLAAVRAVVIDPAIFLDDTEAGAERRDEAISTLAFQLNSAQEREEQAAELQRLRQREIEQAAEIERLAAAERATAEAEERRVKQEAQREADAAAAVEQAARQAEQAAEAAREEERRIAQDMAAEAEERHQQELREMQQRAAAEIEANRQAEERKRAADQDAANVRKVNTAVRLAFIGAGMAKDPAGALTLEIAAGRVPHLRIDYSSEN